MGRPRVLAFILLLIAVMGLAACQPSAGQPGAPPSSEDAIQSRATVTPPIVPTEIPAEPPPSQIGTASAGEIVFVREGQIWAIGVDGSNERPLTELETGDVIRDLGVSPDGRWLAFTVNAQQVLAIDFSAGTLTTVDTVEGGALGSVVWAPESSAIYYEKVTLDIETSTTTSQLWMAVMSPGNISATQMTVPADLDGNSGISPLFALNDGRLIVLQLGGDEGGDTTFFFDPATNLLAPLAEGYSALAVSDDLTQILLLDQSEVSFGRQLTPVNLYRGQLGEASVDGIANITTNNAEGVYFAGQFVPGTSNVVGMYYVPNEAESVANLQTQVILLVADEDGTYLGAPLASSPDHTALDAQYYSGAVGVVVQRLAIAENASEIWLLPLDGSAGAPLTTGEQPRVVGQP